MDELLRMNLHAQALAYLGGVLSLGHLEEWLLQYDPVLLASASPDIVQLSGLLSLGIADVNRGHISEDEFKAEIQQFLGRHTLTLALGERQIFTGSGNQNVQSGTTVLLVRVG
jgi:hypothetical protein